MVKKLFFVVVVAILVFQQKRVAKIIQISGLRPAMFCPDLVDIVNINPYGRVILVPLKIVFSSFQFPLYIIFLMTFFFVCHSPRRSLL